MDKNKWGDFKGKPEWNPTDEEVAKFDKATAGELIQEIAKGGKNKEKVRRWWMKKTGGDIKAYQAQLTKWVQEAVMGD